MASPMGGTAKRPRPWHVYIYIYIKIYIKIHIYIYICVCVCVYEWVAKNETIDSKIWLFFASAFFSGKNHSIPGFIGDLSAAEVLLSALTFDLPKQLAIGGDISFGASEPMRGAKDAQCRIQFQSKSHPST